MAVKIRLKRMGSKKRAFYRIVIADSRAARDGKVVEFIGTYDPHKDPPEIKLDQEKLGFWMGKGALPTDSVRSIIKRAKKQLTESA